MWSHEISLGSPLINMVWSLGMIHSLYPDGNLPLINRVWSLRMIQEKARDLPLINRVWSLGIPDSDPPPD